MFEEKLQFTIKPNKLRLILPKTLLLLVLGLLLYLGIKLNLSLLEINIRAYFNFVIISIILLLILIQAILSSRNLARIRYDFYTDRIVRTGKTNSYISYVQAASISIKKNFFDKIFNTATIKIEPDFRIAPIRNTQKVYDYVQRMIAYYRNQTVHREAEKPGLEQTI